MRTFNKRGDKGKTSLLYGGRVAKTHPRCEAYGTIDEAISALGVARVSSTHKRVKEIVYRIQQELFIVGAEMASSSDKANKSSKRSFTVTEEMLQRLEGFIDELEVVVDMPNAFVIPGACSGSAALDLSRTIIRRAERWAVALYNNDLIKNQNVQSYLNRLSDLVFVLARYEEQQLSK